MQTVEEILGELVDHINSRKDRLTNIDCGVQLNLSGEGGGDYYLRINQDGATLHEGVLEGANITVRVAVDDFKELAAQRLDDIGRALMTGKVKVRGNLALAFKLQNLLR